MAKKEKRLDNTSGKKKPWYADLPDGDSIDYDNPQEADFGLKKLTKPYLNPDFFHLVSVQGIDVDDDEAEDELCQLLRPETMNRDDAKEVFTNCIGYNPTTYWDKQDIESALELALDRLKPKLKEDYDTVKRNTEKIIDNVMRCQQGTRSEMLNAYIVAEISAMVGYSLPIPQLTPMIEEFSQTWVRGSWDSTERPEDPDDEEEEDDECLDEDDMSYPDEFEEDE